MTARIILVRHGRSAHSARGWKTGAGVREWFRAYDAAGIARDDRPPASLIELAGAADVIVSSDMPRAQQSAALLAPTKDIQTSSLLREAEMIIPDLGRARIPLVLWALAIGARWRSGRRSGEIPSPALRERAREAAQMLSGLAESQRTVMAVTHATIRTLIAEALVATGWTREAGWQRYAHWGTWSLRDDRGRTEELH